MTEPRPDPYTAEGFEALYKAAGFQSLGQIATALFVKKRELRYYVSRKADQHRPPPRALVDRLLDVERQGGATKLFPGTYNPTPRGPRPDTA